MKKILLFSFILGNLYNLAAQVPTYVPMNGLVAWYGFNGNATDLSGNNNTCIVNGATLTADRNGVANSAYAFNGTNNWLEKTQPSTNFSATGSFSFSIWVKRNVSTAGVMMMSGSTDANNFVWLLQGDANNVTFGTNKQQSSWFWANSPFALNQWDHYIGVYSNQVMKFYKNGALQSTTNFTHTAVSTANLPLFIGRGVGGSYFNGSLDDIGIWNRALTGCEIQNLYTSQVQTFTVYGGPDTTICAGQPITLSGSGIGLSTFTWNYGIQNNVQFTPSVTRSYTVTGSTASGCTTTAFVTVTVNQPQINAGANQNLCVGQSTALTASGSTNPTWSGGIQNGVSFTPTISQTYTVSGIDANGCEGSDQVVVNVSDYPTVDAGAAVTICQGDSVLLAATGAATYSWNNGALNNSYYAPFTTNYFSVTGTNTGGCSATDSVLITVVSGGNSVLTETAVDSFTLNGQTYTQSGTYTQTIPNTTGCDSTITLELTIGYMGLETIANTYSIAPNPVHDQLVIQTTHGTTAPYTVLDMQGRSIATGQLNGTETNVRLDHIAPGNYLLFIGHEKQAVKLVKH